MGRGGKRSTSWEKGKNPVMAKGTKQKKTILKESLGLSNWDRLSSFISTEGAEKVVEEMMELDGKDFINAYSALAEFVKPKLQRSELSGKDGGPIDFLGFLKASSGT